MQVLRLRNKTESKVELAKLVLTTYCLFSKVKVSPTELEVLSYFAVYGFKKGTKELILRSKILNSPNSLENTITRLRKAGLVVYNRDKLPTLRKEINFLIENKMGIIIQLENI